MAGKEPERGKLQTIRRETARVFIISVACLLFIFIAKEKGEKVSVIVIVIRDL